MRLILRILLPILILACFGYGASHFIRTKPEPKKFTPAPQLTHIEGRTIDATEYQIYLKTRGTVTPRTTTALFPQVSGRIVSISPNFREGGFFEQGDVLLSLEKIDFENSLITATSQLAQARSGLEEEKARGRAAAESWVRLGKSGEPSALVLREPQRLEAEAMVRAADAAINQAELNLDRSDVRAPYAGRILEQFVDVGQFVSSNTQLAMAFSTDVVEVRLPLTNEQLGFVDLPENFRGDSTRAKGPKVKIATKIGRKISTWEGEIVRVDSSIDQASRQLFVVAQIEDPFRREAGEGAPLKMGMFVDALISGNHLKEVIVLPRSAVRVNGEVILVEKSDSKTQIRRRMVEPIWKAENEVVFPRSGGGLNLGDVLCLTPLAYPVDGTEVLATIDGVAPAVEKAGFGGKGKKGKGKKGKGKGSKTKDKAGKKGS